MPLRGGEGRPPLSTIRAPGLPCEGPGRPALAPPPVTHPTEAVARQLSRPTRPARSDDAADRRMALAAIAVLLAVAIAQLGDLVTFSRMIAVSGFRAELNPLVAHGAET